METSSSPISKGPTSSHIRSTTQLWKEDPSDSLQ